jgi:hypothetical protein
MTCNPDRCALGRLLLDRVVDAKLGLQCGGSAARNELAWARGDDLRRHDAEAIRAFDPTIARSAA